MVHTSSVILAATVAFFAVGTTLALPIEQRSESISTRENVDDLESRFIPALIGAAVKIGQKIAHKHHHKREVVVDDIDEFAARDISTRENVDDLESRFIPALIGAAVAIGQKIAHKHHHKRDIAVKIGLGTKVPHTHNHKHHKREVVAARDIGDSELAARDFDTNELEVYGRDVEFDELD